MLFMLVVCMICTDFDIVRIPFVFLQDLVEALLHPRHPLSFSSSLTYWMMMKRTGKKIHNKIIVRSMGIQCLQSFKVFDPDLKLIEVNIALRIHCPGFFQI